MLSSIVKITITKQVDSQPITKLIIPTVSTIKLELAAKHLRLAIITMVKPIARPLALAEEVERVEMLELIAIELVVGMSTIRVAVVGGLLIAILVRVESLFVIEGLATFELVTIFEFMILSEVEFDSCPPILSYQIYSHFIAMGTKEEIRDSIVRFIDQNLAMDPSYLDLFILALDSDNQYRFHQD